jgi:hypothetical protein
VRVRNRSYSRPAGALVRHGFGLDPTLRKVQSPFPVHEALMLAVSTAAGRNIRFHALSNRKER